MKCFTPKNVPNWERAIRIGFGVVLIAIALLQQPFGVIGVIFLIMGGMSAVATGFVGWCPACALVGRKIKQQSKSGL